jgi:ParB family chromosome partitioning protein
MAEFQDNAVFFIEVDKIEPNPYQPRKEFDEEKLNDLAGSIRMYGILQPLTVIRKEHEKEDGGIAVKYELIAGERRLRASKIAGLSAVPALIRTKEDDSRVKLELAIIENLQREDLNPVDRARSFQQLSEEFGLKHIEIAKKVGKSREYVSNTMRLLALPEDMLTALGQKKISEGHTRPLLMLSDRPEEQLVLFKEIMLKKMTVRDAEKIARKVAFDKVRKKERMFDPDIVEMEQEASEHLGTRVHIEPKEVGGRIQIDYFNEDDLKNILKVLNSVEEQKRGEAIANEYVNQVAEQKKSLEAVAPIAFSTPDTDTSNVEELQQEIAVPDYSNTTPNTLEQRVYEEEKKEEIEQIQQENTDSEKLQSHDNSMYENNQSSLVEQDTVIDEGVAEDKTSNMFDQASHHNNEESEVIKSESKEESTNTSNNKPNEDRPTYSLNNFSI